MLFWACYTVLYDEQANVFPSLIEHNKKFLLFLVEQDTTNQVNPKLFYDIYFFVFSYLKCLIFCGNHEYFLGIIAYKIFRLLIERCFKFLHYFNFLLIKVEAKDVLLFHEN